MLTKVCRCELRSIHTQCLGVPPNVNYHLPRVNCHTCSVISPLTATGSHQCVWHTLVTAWPCVTSPVMTRHRLTAMPGRNDAKESPACWVRLGDTRTKVTQHEDCRRHWHNDRWHWNKVDTAETLLVTVAVRITTKNVRRMIKDM